MKVEFIYTSTEQGYKLDMNCFDIPTLPNKDIYNKDEYLKCFKAICERVSEIINVSKK